MKQLPKIVLKKGRDQAIAVGRHPWIFSGAIAGFPKGFLSGDLAEVHSHEGEFLGIAYFHTENSLSGRILSFEKKRVDAILEEKMTKALFLRKSLVNFTTTSAFRVINAEEDGLPGLIVDCYKDFLVIQIGTLGMEKLKDLIIGTLVKVFSPKGIYEKSHSSARIQEGLLPFEGMLYGDDVPEEVLVQENGIPFFVSIIEGQKTGFFLDQREMRRKIGELSNDKQVLNCFSYSGGFSLYALQGGAKKVTSVDTCPKATSLMEKNTEVNGFSLSQHSIVKEDVFHFLDSCDLSLFDIIILDPPAFAKKRQDIDMACKGYRQLAEKVFARCKSGTLFLSCSCSYFIDAALFQKTMFQAASNAKKDVQIISKHIQAMDHPISLYHPEGDYLKSLLFFIS